MATPRARAGSGGLAAAGRSAIVIAVRAPPLVLAPGVAKLGAEPNPFGTSVFLFGSFLLIDKAATRWFTAPLVCVILCVGQIGDVTVRYVAVPAIVVVCAYHVLAARRLRTHDMAVAGAAAASGPLSVLARAVLPCGAVLAARACVPGNIVSLPRARAVFAAAVLAAVLPLATAAARPLEVQEQARVAAWLDAHGFRYGLAWFGNASTVTVQSGGRVQVRAVQSPG